jgi:hypothetical protein
MKQQIMLDKKISILSISVLKILTYLNSPSLIILIVLFTFVRLCFI